jgi:hypothetical protein
MYVQRQISEAVLVEYTAIEGLEARWTALSLQVRIMRCLVNESHPPVIAGEAENLDLYV